MTNTIKLDKKFFTGRRRNFHRGQRQGHALTRSNPTAKGENKPFFISMLTGPDNWANYTYMGIFRPGHVSRFASPQRTVTMMTRSL